MERDNLYDICIVGGGVAGASLAGYLGYSGLRILVIEKNFSEQDRIVGELLQPGGVQMLEQMGMGHLLEGFDAQPVKGYALFMNDSHFRIEYPKSEGIASTGYGMRNGKFVQSLRAYMSSQPNVAIIEANVKSLVVENERICGVQYQRKSADSTEIAHARLTVMCDGIFSTFRQELAQPAKHVTSYFLGMILRDCTLPYPNHGHVIIAEPAPVVIYPISSTETRILIDFPNQIPKKGEWLNHYLHHILAPQLPPSIRPAFENAVVEGKFKVMPNHRLGAKPNRKAGAVLLGDSLNMRHPLTGGGMTAVFSDVYLLGSLLKGIKDTTAPEPWNRAVIQFYNQRHTQTASINILADALYGVMRNVDLKRACFDYLQRGGKFSEEPAAILSGISRNEKLLLRHFFSVAGFGIRRVISPLPTLSKTIRSYKMMRDAIQIMFPLLRQEQVFRLNPDSGIGI